MKERLFLTLLQMIPKKTVSRWMGRLARTSFSRRLIPYYIRRFDVDLSQISRPVSEYGSLLDFFVRGLQEGARPVHSDPESVTSPVDGTISQIGSIDNGTLLQAKGVSYSLEALLGGDKEKVRDFQGGWFLTIYLSPRDYHRIHTPIQGRVTSLTYIPGTLFPVNAFGVRKIPGLFAKNERLITYMEGTCGRVAVVKVGATNVGSIKVNYDPEVTTNRRRGKQVEKRAYPSKKVLEKGAELGRFEFGSTVILLFQPECIQWNEGMAPGSILKMGQPVGQVPNHAPAEEPPPLKEGEQRDV
ncbi:archaetidylserine decarboxylase [Paludifilum halophilum]|uniref:Phosphatidylserine decarboxylase proenzyme n=1 Tax=Paludifilum halophilum TaxID=1642702 RepID=A0A235BA77_9BACL|nr:archaetidylserine decarboxylase [Paludifilum halophilum]OYD08889.1 phosphatidylserine decarboxylase [Paludifilum halophilum]